MRGTLSNKLLMVIGKGVWLSHSFQSLAGKVRWSSYSVLYCDMA